MASIYKPRIVEYRLPETYIGPDGLACEQRAQGAKRIRGQRVKPGTPGARKIRRKSRKYVIEYRDAGGLLRRVTGYADLPASRQLAARLEKKAAHKQEGMIDPTEEHRRRPMADHLADYRRDLLSRNDTPAYVEMVISRLTAIME